MSDDKDRWKETAGLAADSTVVRIVRKEPDKKEWGEDAEEKDHRGTSKYLYELVVIHLKDRWNWLSKQETRNTSNDVNGRCTGCGV